MVNCVVSNFDFVLSDDCLSRTPRVDCSFLNCAFVGLKSAFRLENPSACRVDLQFQQCVFDQCLKTFTIKSNSAKVKLSKCNFKKNTQCFALQSPSRGSGSRGAPGEPPKSLATSGDVSDLEQGLVLVSHSVFGENQTILRAENFEGKIEFRSNRVKLTKSEGLFFGECPRVRLHANVFEMNFKDNPDMLSPGESSPFASDYLNFTEKLENSELRLKILKNKIQGAKWYLLKLHNSSVSIEKNLFRNNDGSLIVWTEKAPSAAKADSIESPEKRPTDPPKAKSSSEARRGDLTCRKGLGVQAG